MTDNVDKKVKAAKDAWAQLEVDDYKLNGTNSQGDVDYSKSIATVYSETDEQMKEEEALL